MEMLYICCFPGVAVKRLCTLPAPSFPTNIQSPLCHRADGAPITPLAALRVSVEATPLELGGPTTQDAALLHRGAS